MRLVISKPNRHPPHMSNFLHSLPATCRRRAFSLRLDVTLAMAAMSAGLLNGSSEALLLSAAAAHALTTLRWASVARAHEEGTALTPALLPALATMWLGVLFASLLGWLAGSSEALAFVCRGGVPTEIAAAGVACAWLAGGWAWLQAAQTASRQVNLLP